MLIYLALLRDSLAAYRAEMRRVGPRAATQLGMVPIYRALARRYIAYVREARHD